MLCYINLEPESTDSLNIKPESTDTNIVVLSNDTNIGDF
jgi:hypothetical protein